MPTSPLLPTIAAILGVTLGSIAHGDETPSGPPSAAPVENDPERPFRVEFVGGDRLHGELIAVDPDGIRWRVGAGDEFAIPLSALARIERTDGTAAWTPEIGDLHALLPEMKPIELPPPEDLGTGQRSTPADEAVTPEVDPVEAADEVTPPVFALLKPEAVLETAVDWTQRIEIGGQFVDGNSESDSLNVAAKFARETSLSKLKLDLGGNLGSADGVYATNNWFANVTADFDRATGSRWLLFVTSRNEYDEFENLDYRGTLSGGLGYRVVLRPEHTFIVRVGPGVTAEYYRYPYRERITPDLFGQIEIKWPLFDRLIFEQDTTVIPAMTDQQVLRAKSRTGFILPLDEDRLWSLKLGVRVDYDSEPNRNRVPLDYTTTLVLVYQRKK